ncbi:hypothetical protein DL98DRAFT_654044 [Cadophora sp. DSE1049]|nr:hypothetical protein DL98DRAFT_654044 [Cadophora sp. DSE1049]
MTTKTTTHLFHSTQTQTATVHVTVKDTTTISIIRSSVKTSTTKITSTVNVTKTTTLKLCSSSLLVPRSDVDEYPLESVTDGVLTNVFPTSQPCKIEYPVTTEGSSKAVVTIILTTISTLTSCPHKAACTGQKSTWTGSNGPLPCSAQSTCSCVLPGGTQTITSCPTSVRCVGKTTQWIGSEGPSICAEGVTCNWVMPDITKSSPPAITEVLSVDYPANTNLASSSAPTPTSTWEQVDSTAISEPFAGDISASADATSTSISDASGRGTSKSIGGFVIIAVVMTSMCFI